MGVAEKKTQATVQDYLDYLDAIAGRAEFYDGVVHDKIGGSINHTRIIMNTSASIYNRLPPSGCEVFSMDLKTEVQFQKTYTLPDIAVICGPPELSYIREDIVRNPTLIVEVLSQSTASFDRTKKFDKYKQLRSLREYVLVEQTDPRVEVFSLQDNGKWEYEVFSDLEGTVALKSIGLEIPMADIYRNVQFEELDD